MEIKKELMSVIMTHTADISLGNKLANDIYDFLYEMPEENVTIVKERFKKRRVDGGWEYKFYTDGKWEDKWNYVPKS